MFTAFFRRKWSRRQAWTRGIDLTDRRVTIALMTFGAR